MFFPQILTGEKLLLETKHDQNQSFLSTRIGGCDMSECNSFGQEPVHTTGR